MPATKQKKPRSPAQIAHAKRLPSLRPKRRSAKGTFISNDGNDKFERWNRKGIEGFAHFFKDTQPQILHADGLYRKIKLTASQGDLLKKVYAINGRTKRLKHTMVLNIEPRRHGKSTVFALVVLHHFFAKKNHTTQLSGNTAGHSLRTQFNLITRIIQHTGSLRTMLKDSDYQTNVIKNPRRGNLIQAMSGANLSAGFGDRLNIIWHSDMHANSDSGYWNALQASLLDSQGSICLIDSNVDYTQGPVHQLQLEAKKDKSIFCRHVSYKDMETYCKEAPAWIDKQKARRLERTLLPVEFSRDILGKRADSKNALFPSAVIELCKSDYKIPVQDLKALTQGRAYKVGAGLDRAKSIFGAATGSDNTCLTIILKVASPEHGEPEYFVLDQNVIFPNTSRNVKKHILKAHQRYKLDNITLENYEVTDLTGWLEDQKIPFEQISAHEKNQAISFAETFRTSKEGRLHFPKDLKGLAEEMRTFAYVQKANSKFTFGHSSNAFKDDRVYSLSWSIFSLRESVLNLYVLENIQCLNKSTRRNFCYLLGGPHTLACGESCIAHQQVEKMFMSFKAYKFDSEISIIQFFIQKVKLTGARIYQAQ